MDKYRYIVMCSLLSPKSIFIGLASWFIACSGVYGDQTKLDFSFFMKEVQPIFLAKRPGNMRCVDCHAGKSYSAFNLQPLSPGQFFWNEQESLKNFQAASNMTVAGADPLASRLLTHPLARAAGGDPFHGGGKHFESVSDPEWKILKAWVAGATARQKIGQTIARIIQTNAASDVSHVIDPLSNKVVALINDVEIPHGVVGAPDAQAIYFSNEKLHTLDVIDSRTLRVHRRIQLSGKPNNVAVSRDGSKVYVAIMEMPGSVDVIDTQIFKKIKTIPVKGAIHRKSVV